MTPTLTTWLGAVALLLAVLTVASGLIWLERKLLALWQDRRGPNRIGPMGILQIVPDMIKIFTKEDWVPPFAEKAIFVIAPAILMVSITASFAVLVFAPGLCVADINIGVLFFLGFSSLGVYGVALAGWSSRNKYALLGSLRAAGQMISYETFMGLSLVGVVLLAGSFDIGQIIRAQQHLWFVALQPVGFLIFLIAGFAETRRLPFDLPEAENELVAGYHSEYSGMKFALFFLSEYMGITLVSSMIVTLFFGGYLGPWMDVPGLPILWFILKVFAFIAFFILVRASLPRPRYDQLMALAWKLLLPLSLANLLATGAIMLAVQK